MQDYVIATASTVDLTAQWLDEHHVPFIPYHYIMDGTEYNDDCLEETRYNIYDAMRNGASLSTAAISVFEYHEFFEKLLQETKQVIYLDMSSAISSSINNARSAIEMIQDEHPDCKVVFIDSFCITGILGLLIKKMVAMKEAGASFEEVIQYAEEHKDEYIGRFMVDDLQWLKKGGRLSNGAAFFGMLLSIKPLIYVDKAGKLVAYAKCHGKRKAWGQLVAGMKDDLRDYTNDEETYIIHSGTPEDAEKFKAMIQEAYPQLTNVTINTLGPVITAHVGPGFMAVVVHGGKRTM